jgi:hypothetical protein
MTDFAVVDAYLAVRSKDGGISPNPVAFSDPDSVPVVVAKYQPSSGGCVTTTVYHSDLNRVEIIDGGLDLRQASLWDEGSSVWIATFETIKAFADKLDAGPKLPSFKARWSLEAEQDLRSIHNIESMVDVLTEQIIYDIDKEFLDNPKEEVPLEIESTTIALGRLTSSVRTR